MQSESPAGHGLVDAEDNNREASGGQTQQVRERRRKMCDKSYHQNMQRLLWHNGVTDRSGLCRVPGTGIPILSPDLAGSWSIAKGELLSDASRTGRT